MLCKITKYVVEKSKGKYIEVESLRSSPNDYGLQYAPKAYPLHAASHLTRSENVEKLLSIIEEHPDTNGSPVFDQIWIVVPSVTGYFSQDGYQLRTSDGVQYWSNSKQHSDNLENYLAVTRQAVPVIMGEHYSSKKCYFIGLWV